MPWSCQFSSFSISGAAAAALKPSRVHITQARSQCKKLKSELCRSVTNKQTNKKLKWNVFDQKNLAMLSPCSIFFSRIYNKLKSSERESLFQLGSKDLKFAHCNPTHWPQLKRLSSWDICGLTQPNLEIIQIPNRPGMLLNPLKISNLTKISPHLQKVTIYFFLEL